MKERPILFSAPMVKAILDGRKTQTRRVVKPQPPTPEAVHKLAGIDYGWIAPKSPRPEWRPDGPVWAVRELMGMEPMLRCPYGQPGNRLWVRETWQAFFDDEIASDRPRGPQHTMGIPARPDRKSFVFYRADGEVTDHPEHGKARWMPSIFLPRKYSRITLEITGVRVERLQDISTEDCIAEGITTTLRDHDAVCDLRDQFRELWQSINGPDSWDANPWVWVVEFKAVQ